MAEMRMKRAGRGVLALLLLAVAGCGKGPPLVTEVEGVVLLNNQPLPSALVEFLPQEQLGPEWISRGSTDARGHFTLSFPYANKTGAVVGKHKVTLRDAPPPAEARGMSVEAQKRAAQYKRGLANRPIPEQYGSATLTPLEIEITADKKSYELKLTRQ
jgi:hypothetical protein